MKYLGFKQVICRRDRDRGRWRDGWRGDVREEMFDREGRIGHDSGGHGLNESDGHRKERSR